MVSTNERISSIPIEDRETITKPLLQRAIIVNMDSKINARWISSGSLDNIKKAFLLLQKMIGLKVEELHKEIQKIEGTKLSQQEMTQIVYSAFMENHTR